MEIADPKNVRGRKNQKPLQRMRQLDICILRDPKNVKSCGLCWCWLWQGARKGENRL